MERLILRSRADVNAYDAAVASTVEQLTVTAATSHADATFTISPSGLTPTTVAPNGRQVNLTTGANTITVTVTAADGHDQGGLHHHGQPRCGCSDRATAVVCLVACDRAELAVTWRAPANEGAMGIDRYQFRKGAGDWADVDANNGGAAGNGARTASVPGTVDGRSTTIDGARSGLWGRRHHVRWRRGDASRVHPGQKISRR